MKNPGSYLRQAIATTLSGITYSGNAVPVYENESVSGTDYQIVIGEYSDTDASNKDTFAASAQQVIEVVAEQSTAARKYVDAIGDLVMNAIKPTTRSEGIAENADWQIFTHGRPSVNYLTEDTQAGYIVRLIMRFEILLIQKTQ